MGPVSYVAGAWRRVQSCGSDPGGAAPKSASCFLARDPARQLAILLSQFEQALARLRPVFHLGQRLEPVGLLAVA